MSSTSRNEDLHVRPGGGGERETDGRILNFEFTRTQLLEYLVATLKLPMPVVTLPGNGSTFREDIVRANTYTKEEFGKLLQTFGVDLTTVDLPGLFRGFVDYVREEDEEAISETLGLDAGVESTPRGTPSNGFHLPPIKPRETEGLLEPVSVSPKTVSPKKGGSVLGARFGLGTALMFGLVAVAGLVNKVMHSGADEVAPSKSAESVSVSTIPVGNAPVAPTLVTPNPVQSPSVDTNIWTAVGSVLDDFESVSWEPSSDQERALIHAVATNSLALVASEDANVVGFTEGSKGAKALRGYLKSWGGYKAVLDSLDAYAPADSCKYNPNESIASTLGYIEECSGLPRAGAVRNLVEAQAHLIVDSRINTDLSDVHERLSEASRPVEIKGVVQDLVENPPKVPKPYVYEKPTTSGSASYSSGIDAPDRSVDSFASDLGENREFRALSQDVQNNDLEDPTSVPEPRYVRPVVVSAFASESAVDAPDRSVDSFGDIDELVGEKVAMSKSDEVVSSKFVSSLADATDVPDPLYVEPVAVGSVVADGPVTQVKKSSLFERAKAGVAQVTGGIATRARSWFGR
ncbi:MAG: hypothetical protein WC897_02240 [Candidatus Gracilibacteria bacterium]